ncbi:MAG: elongation factor G [Desulfuromonadaceae bacterium]|nr:elongation factor G [Desulfuromonadaceae bacterium]
MNHPPRNKIRNIGIISHIDAGKTTVSERCLFYSGEIHQLGEVHDGAATMDWMEQEQERGITITATATACHWRDVTINIIDTPGHIDFTIEVERSLRVLDGAVMIFSAVEGVQPQSESVWRQADRYQVPRICLINKMDRLGADHCHTLAEIEDQLAARPALLQLPYGEENAFSGVIDVIEKRLVRFFADDLGATVTATNVPAELVAAVDVARDQLVEIAADFDDQLLCSYLAGEEIAADQLKAALRRGTLACRIFPTLLGSALRNKGIQPLLDAVIDYLPAPTDLPAITAQSPDGTIKTVLEADPQAPFCGLAFKVQADEGRKLTYLRIYSGTLRAGDSVYNVNRTSNEKAARLFRMHAHKRERLDDAIAGDVVAVAGLKHVLTGDTLSTIETPLLLPGLTAPEPMVSVAVEAMRIEDREKLPLALDKLQWEDPTFRAIEDEETGQTVLTGMGELHLEIIVHRLEHEFGVAVRTGNPRVIYREALTVAVERQESVEQEIEGKLQRVELALRLTPTANGSGLQIVLPTASDAEALPENLREVLASTLKQALQGGVRFGYPVTDLEITVVACPYRSGEFNAFGLRAAAQRVIRHAAEIGKPTLLEPLMELELTIPGDHAGKVLGTIQRKRGLVEGMSAHSGSEIIRAQAPLAEMFGFMTELRSATQGRGTFTMEFSHFAPAPAEVLKRFGG